MKVLDDERCRDNKRYKLDFYTHISREQDLYRAGNDPNFLDLSDTSDEETPPMPQLTNYPCTDVVIGTLPLLILPKDLGEAGVGRRPRPALVRPNGNNCPTKLVPESQIRTVFKTSRQLKMWKDDV